MKIKTKTEFKDESEEFSESILKPDEIDEIVAKFKNQPGELLLILENLQKANKYNYLPEDTLQYVAKTMQIPYAQLYSVATFFSFFNLIPEGDHCITICRGTACHTKRSRFLLDFIVDYLNIEQEINENEKIFITTPDRQFTVRTIACFGQCALSPVIEVDGVIHAHMNIEKMKNIIVDIKQKDLVKKEKGDD